MIAKGCRWDRDMVPCVNKRTVTKCDHELTGCHEHQDGHHGATHISGAGGGMEWMGSRGIGVRGRRRGSVFTLPPAVAPRVDGTPTAGQPAAGRRGRHAL